MSGIPSVYSKYNNEWKSKRICTWGYSCGYIRDESTICATLVPKWDGPRFGAIRYIGSTPTAILGALEPVTAVFIGVVVFGETLTLRIIMGIILIILAVTLIIEGNNIEIHLVRFRKMFPRLPKKKSFGS